MSILLLGVQVTRPASPRYIRIYETNAATLNALPSASSRQIAAVNTLSASAVLIKNTSLTFYLPWSIRLAPNVIHYITIDNGAVVGLGASCAGDGIPFGGIRDRTMWSFPTGKWTFIDAILSLYYFDSCSEYKLRSV